MKAIYPLLFFLCIVIPSCSTGDETEKKDQPEKPEQPAPEKPNPDEDGIDYSKVGVEYDDGKNVVFNVKIAIDKEGWSLKSPNWFKEKLKAQWDEINKRFNDLDKKKVLDRHYIFVPDLNDILICEEKSNGFGISAVRKNLFDKNKFQVIVTYDFYCQKDKGERGGGCWTEEGISQITVINPGYESRFCDHFNKEVAPYTADAITHELGHFRGITDLYKFVVTKENNKVNNEAFKPISCAMNDVAYGDIDKCYWSDYAIKIINLNREKKIVDIINRTTLDYFPQKLIVEVTENGKPSAGFNTKIYAMEYGSKEITNKVRREASVTGNKFLTDAISLFWPAGTQQYIYATHTFILVEVTSNVTGKKAYNIIPYYELHNYGLDEKQGDKDKVVTYTRVIDIK